MQKKNLSSILLITFFSLFLFSCSEATQNKSTLQSKSIVKNEVSQVTDGQEWQEVTVNYYRFEGGFYGLTSQFGDKLLPINLDKQYRLDGTVLRVKGELIKDMITIQQWGHPFKISDVKLIKLGKVVTKKGGAEY